MLNSRKQRRILQNPALQGVLFAVAWLLVTNVTIYFIYLRSVEAVKGEIRDGLLRNVSMAATTLDGDTHNKFTAETQPNDPVYLNFIARMEMIRRASSDVRYMYTNTSKNGKIYFVANGAPQDDNDNDGFNDKIETNCGTNPFDSSDFPPDSEGDNIIDCLDRDIDNDGVINKEDAFPEDSSEYGYRR